MTSLRELDVGKAANLLTWTLKVESPRVTNVKYLYQGNTVSYQKFECLLVAEDNSYCAVELKSTQDHAKLAAEAFEQFVDQSTWQKKVINLGATKMQKTDVEGQWFVQPAITVAECADLQGDQMFDCMGYLENMSLSFFGCEFCTL